MAPSTEASEFPCSLTLDVPFPTPRLASVAFQSLGVDKELSPLVRRHLSTVSLSSSDFGTDKASDGGAVLRVAYRATTNRMLRVAVNSFMDSLALVLEVMEALDVDVLEAGKGQDI